MYKYRKILKFLNRAVYLMSAGMMMVGLVLTVAPLPASAAPAEKVILCHAAGQDDTLNFTTVEISWNAAYGTSGHFYEDGTPQAGHENDYLGPCATEVPTYTPTNTTVPVGDTPVPDTATPTMVNTDVNTATATFTEEPTNTATATMTELPTNTPTATFTNTPTITPNLLVVTMPDPYCVSMPGDKMQWTVVNNNAESFNILDWSIDGVMQSYGFVVPVGVTLLAQTDLGTHTIVLYWEQEGSVTLEYTIESCALPNTATPTLTATTVPVEATPVEKVTICHAAGRDDTTHFVTLNIGWNAVYGLGGHFNENGSPKAGHEQDYLGPCIVGVPTATIVPVEATPEGKVEICHAAGQDDTLHFVTLNIGWNAVYGPGGHFNENGTPKAGHEQDYLGACIVAAPTSTPVPVVNTPMPTITPNLLVVTMPDPYCVSMPGDKMQWTVVNNNAQPFNILSWSIDGVMQPYGFVVPVGVTLLAQTDLGEHNIVLNWEQDGSVALEYTIESCALPNTPTPTLTATTVPVEATPEGKVTICHAAGLDGTLHYVTLNIGWNAVYGSGGHFNENGTPKAGHEQDYLGACIVGVPTSTPVIVVNTPVNTATLMPTNTTVPVEATPEGKVTICHAAGQADTLHYVTLNIGWNAVYGPGGHFNENGTPQAGHEQDSLGACPTVTPTTVPVVATPVPNTATPTITPNLLVVTMPEPYCVSLPGNKMQWTVVNNNAQPFNILSWSIDGVMQPYGFAAPVGVTLLAQTDLGTHTIVLNWEQEGSASLEFTIESCAIPNTATAVPATNTPVYTATLLPTNTPVNTATLIPTSTIVPVANTPVNTATLIPTSTIVPVANTPVNTATLIPTSTIVPATNTPMPTVTPNLLFVTMPEPYCVSLPGDKMQWTVVNNNAQPFNILSWSIDGVMQPYGFTAPVGVTLLAQTDLGEHNIVLNWEQKGSAYLEFTIESCAEPTATPTNTAVPATSTPVNTATLVPTATLMPTNTLVPVANTPVNTATLIPTSTIVPATNTPMPTVTPNLLFVTMPEPYCVSLPGSKIQWTVVNNNAQPFNILSWSIDGVAQPYGFTAPVGVTLLAQTELGTHNIVLNWEQEGSASLQFTIDSCAAPTALAPANTAVPVTNIATTVPTLSIPKTSGTEIPIIPVTGADLNKSVNGWFFGGFGMLGFGLILSGLRKMFDL